MLYILALLVFAADQGIKWLVQTHMVQGESIPIWPSVLEIQYIRNPGAAWGILQQAHWLLVLVALAVIAAVVWIERKYRPKFWVTVGLALVLGGALGNLCDRVFAGTVVDYVYIEAINFPVFNLADTCIDVGVVLLLWRSFRADKSVKQNTEDVTK
ncbi:signal peptidase II [Alicyclobacillus pomorum]|jgi:signal peptidase II|uniref:signal peptidase II n=1 Tax=Alicyclobacillus pomorum TaxID=204470 RepID=UPI0003FCFC52|nr:signal peptidase II [Alicyclobacillus pomorum]